MSDQVTPRTDPAPSPTYTIKGGSSVVWGVAGTNAAGTVLTCDIDDSAAYEKIESQTGAVTGIVIYDTETTIKMSIIAGASAARPAIGDTLTVGSLSGTVLKSSLKAANKQTVKFEVEASKWANLTLT